MTADAWDGPVCATCKGRGEVVLTGRSWVSLRCDDCHGSGLADTPPPPPRYREDGFRLPEDGEAYDPAVHGPIPVGCWLCGGLGVRGATRKPCPACQQEPPPANAEGGR